MGRKKLIDQWEEAVKNMKTRDGQLEKLGEEYASNLGRKRSKEDKMKEKKKMHEDVEAENNKMEEGIQQTDRQLVRMRLDHMETKGSLGSFKDEVEVMKNQLQACETEKNKHTVLMRGLEQRKEKYEQLHKHFKMHQRGLD